MSDAHGMETLSVIERGVGPAIWSDPACDADEEYLQGEEAVLYRRTAAKLNYISLGHPQVAYASKEASRTMAEPRKGDLNKIKPVLRYLRSYPTSVYYYDWQEAPGLLTGYTDNDWAGCRRTRKSTSGGAVLHGTQLLLHWSRTQAGVALSSAEAELNATVKLGCEVLGIRQFCGEMGDDLEIVIRG